MTSRPSLPKLLRTGAVITLASIALSVVAAVPAHAAAAVFDPDTNNSAYAWHLNPANEVAGGNYAITLDPDGRSGTPGGNSALTWGPGTIKISTGCPSDYRASSRSFIVTERGLETEIVVPRVGQDSTGWGLDGEAIKLSAGRDVGDWSPLNASKLPTGTNALVITCDPTAVADTVYAIPTDQPIANSKYFVAYIQVDRAAKSWTRVAKPAASKTATTTTLAASGTTATSTTLTATVSPTAATGSVTFSQGGTEVGKADVSNGVATLGVSGLTPATAYSFTAAYSGDSAYEASTTSAATDVTTVTPAASGSTDVTVSVPDAASSQPTGLKIAVASTSVKLASSEARTSGAVWNATGSLGEVTVTDDRRKVDAAAWTLNGSATKFSGSAGDFASSNLGWAPKLVSGSGAKGDTASDLSKEQKLASGAQPTTESNVVTKIDADLTLKVPSEVKTGDYTAKLTLTLI